MPSLLAQQVGYSAARLFVVSSAAVRRHGSGRASQSHPYVRQQGRASSDSWDELRGCLWSALRPSAGTARARRSQSHPCVRQQGRAGPDGWGGPPGLLPCLSICLSVSGLWLFLHDGLGMMGEVRLVGASCGSPGSPQ